MHCRWRQKGETTAAPGNRKTNRKAKWAALTGGQNSASPAAALFLCSLSEWDPRYISQEQAWSETEGENFLVDGWWKFTDDHIAIPESLAPTFVKQFQEGTHWRQIALETTLAQHFYVTKLSSVRQYVKGAVCVPETIPSICWCLSILSQDG
jgi:hypothetical protein